eukprot:CAMPEP_0206221552 /NCGR_PEP_ID=MMETSP0047_2-20121206/5479_1 /ASSEMBLY_ACC=CAM_ASM_000192 /TAXON_ID=195065 /ORGANISM="Chroomonas mesostigmatica_cf, Strain CCMP1168" /LENGTH=62 /DNA_ID=CAMNT_0053644301 /DNA_START=450 /DNA_END=635 /DNA_ORIENTATION=+
MAKAGSLGMLPPWSSTLKGMPIMGGTMGMGGGLIMGLPPWGSIGMPEWGYGMPGVPMGWGGR